MDIFRDTIKMSALKGYCVLLHAIEIDYVLLAHTSTSAGKWVPKTLITKIKNLA